MNEHFVIAGAQRCGTTFLYRYLSAHPEIEMAAPERPEPKYFLRNDMDNRSVEHYREVCFGRKSGARRFGEKSTSYLEYEDVAEHLVKTLPGVQVVVVVRDPVDRAVSNVRFSQDNGLEQRSLEEALCPGGPSAPTWDRDQVSVDPFAYVERGRYIEYLDRYLRHIDRQQLHLIVFEEMIATDEPLLRLLEHLGVDPSLAPRRPEPVNASVGVDRTELTCIDDLRASYRDSIRGLERLLGRSLDCWPSSA